MKASKTGTLAVALAEGRFDRVFAPIALLTGAAFLLILILPLAEEFWNFAPEIEMSENRSRNEYSPLQWTAQSMSTYPARFEGAFNDHFRVPDPARPVAGRGEVLFANDHAGGELGPVLSVLDHIEVGYASSKTFSFFAKTNERKRI